MCLVNCLFVEGFFFVLPLVCDKVFCAISNSKIVSLRKRELVALIYMYSSLYEYVFVYVLV